MVYGDKLTKLADEIETLRTDIYKDTKLNLSVDDKTELDNLLFSIQSKLRYDTKEIIDCYEI